MRTQSWNDLIEHDDRTSEYTTFRKGKPYNVTAVADEAEASKFECDCLIHSPRSHGKQRGYFIGEDS